MSGNAIQDPSLLCQFVLITFAVSTYLSLYSYCEDVHHKSVFSSLHSLMAYLIFITILCFTLKQPLAEGLPDPIWYMN